MGELQKVLAGLKEGYSKTDAAQPLAVWQDSLAAFKRLAIYFSGVCAQKFMEKLKEKESLLITMADLIIESYAMHCGMERALKIRKLRGEAGAKLAENMVAVYMAEKIPEMVSKVRQALFNVADGNEKEFGSYQKALERLIQPQFADTEKIKEQIAAHILEKERYTL